jgi:ectoine hydroxylase-related dioxygenase (phytanoyl-CoA dioxygenase family)
MNDAAVIEPLPSLTDVGRLGVYQLKRAWASRRPGAAWRTFDPAEFHRDRLLFHALGLGLEQTVQYLGQGAASFEEFERWIVATTGGVPAVQVARINAALTGTAYPPQVDAALSRIDAAAPVLSADDLAFWEEHGYVVVHDAVPADSCAAARDAVLDHLDARLDDPETWYGRNRSIMVQHFQHSAFDANRGSPRIHKAFAQLWGTADLWVTVDRVGFNPPERPGWRFPGPDLHWDVSLAQPIPPGMAGILYLIDTAPAQGAFTCVPGFHRRIADWLEALPAGADPRQQDLHALGAKPIPGRAGDLVIWNDALPHGSSPNRHHMPRIVQYIAMYPTTAKAQSVWK